MADDGLQSDRQKMGKSMFLQKGGFFHDLPGVPYGHYGQIPENANVLGSANS